MKKHFVILLLFLFFSFSGKSQSSLGIGQFSSIISNDTLPAYATDSISFWVINYGTVVFNDQIRLFTNVRDSAGVLFHAVDTAYTGLVNIPAGDSLLVNLYPYYEIDFFNKYHYNINVIVIWPVAMTGTTNVVDSLHYNEFILLPASVDEIDLNKVIKAYPNPAFHDINLENTGKNRIEEVRIMNSQGQLITIIRKQEKICVEDWPPGLYIFSVLLENKQTHTVKIVKQ